MLYTVIHIISIYIYAILYHTRYVLYGILYYLMPGVYIIYIYISYHIISQNPRSMATLAASLSQGLGLLDATVLGIVASSAALVPRRPAMACPLPGLVNVHKKPWEITMFLKGKSTINHHSQHKSS